MPSKKKLNAAKRAGVNPYAVCNAQAKKTGMGKSKRERCVHHVTDRATKKK